MALLTVGQLVTSKKGRDYGRLYVVIGFCEQGHVQVADGFVRKISRPKRKNIRHLVAHQANLGATEFDDKMVREFISNCSAEKPGEGGPTVHGQG